MEYFAECSLCPQNETYVRVQAGTEDPVQIGDKGKWFSDSLMPIHFTVHTYQYHLSAINCCQFEHSSVNVKRLASLFQVYPSESTLTEAWRRAVSFRNGSASGSFS